MKRLMLLGVLIGLGGCGGALRYNVSGASGKLYTAPDICQALVQCKNASESSCFYQTSKVTTIDGKAFDESYCKEVSK